MKFTIISSITFLLFTLQANLFGQDALIGNWFAKDLENSTIQIYREKDNQIYAKIIKSDDAELIDHMVLERMIYNPAKKVWQGTISSPRRPIEVDGTITLISNDKLKLVGKKYFLTKTFYWTKK